ncbi:MAG: EF-hand domain-containing protein [Thioalkalispiraceae bacterium]|jgi:Ca2+-binding EF-hand superfamily protein
MKIRHIIYLVVLTLGAWPLTATSQEKDEMKFEILDNDGDGFISRSEATANVTLRERWNNVDKNKDGKLTEEEFTAFIKVPKEPLPQQ